MLRFLPVVAVPLVLLADSLVAQSGRRPVIGGSIGFAGGRYGFENDDRSLDDSTQAGLLLLEFEATSRRGFGGGLRYETLRSNDNLFVVNGAPPNEARNDMLFAHATYRLHERRFDMPIRFGLMLNNLTLEEDTTSLQADYASIGPYVEVEPEFLLVRSGDVQLSLYGQFGGGYGFTGIDIDGDFRDYVSSTGFFGVEAGTRFRFGPAQVSVGYVGRFQTMGESGVESNQVALGYDSYFNGLLLAFGVVF